MKFGCQWGKQCHQTNVTLLTVWQVSTHGCCSQQPSWALFVWFMDLSDWSLIFLCKWWVWQGLYVHSIRCKGLIFISAVKWAHWGLGILKYYLKLLWNGTKEKYYLVIHSHVLFYITFSIMCIQCLLLLPVVSVNSIAITGFILKKRKSENELFFIFV